MNQLHLFSTRELHKPQSWLYLNIVLATCSQLENNHSVWSSYWATFTKLVEHRLTPHFFLRGSDQTHLLSRHSITYPLRGGNRLFCSLLKESNLLICETCYFTKTLLQEANLKSDKVHYNQKFCIENYGRNPLI